MCGVEFRDAELRKEFGVVPHREFHGRAGTQLGKVWEMAVFGQIKLWSVMSQIVVNGAKRRRERSRRRWRLYLECGIEVWVRLRAQLISS